MDLAARKEKPLAGFGLFGVIKETGVDDDGLVEFYQESFTQPLYKDENRDFFNDFFGGKKLGFTTFNPIRLYKGYKAMTARLNEKGLSGNLKGEGLVQGGIIVFGSDGKAKFAYREETGKEVPIHDIISAVNNVKEER